MNSNVANQSILQTHFWDQSLSFISPAVLVEVHRHRCFQVVITLTSTFDCLIEGQELNGLRGFIVNQNIPHACRVSSGEVFVSFIEADSYWGWQLRSWLDGKPYLNIAELLEPGTFHSLLPDGYERMTNDALIAYINLFFERIFPPVSPRQPGMAPYAGLRYAQFGQSGDQRSNPWNANEVDFHQADEQIDKRIELALRYINQHLHQRLAVEDMAAHIYLSPVRARHLFASKTGTPFTQYVLWKRIKGILNAVINGECTLADACIDFGFVDQSHFNRQFKQIFGTPPNALIKGGRVILQGY